jgi:hypothetical protein
MRRSVRAVIKTQLALIAEIRDAPQVPGIQPFRLPVDRLPVEAIKEIAERRAEVKAAPATIANIKDATKFVVCLLLIPERLVVRFKDHRSSAKLKIIHVGALS